ncbi:16S rRNA (guanine(527)-N(7))-methyltransferase RsmG [Paracrocinitomix mangrovi]|uniref:16S rRNA (guanine(527)-N(7))-methyltransferase RsmG n=1 Tax=Paracrocinitomix mangrovi TaxID=2862509 RepID=UPI001C8F1D4F|nr:16S rRNA (guanine(527)-N(7))-methyltransferase RsmG [Paracrocinitomix mangrovi]UKN01392.1 16S rRNA (guanine(527)-N(7))-methyltransferase RsmG [Paracrocinitomix mangrovi]
MVTVDIIYKYFPNLSPIQKKQFALLYDVYKDWNEQINVVSRKDFDNFYERHVLHSLGIAKIINFQDGSEILDVGTGGGFPGIPLAIMFPECDFYLVDSIGKKIKVVNEVKEELGLDNVFAAQVRAEQLKQKFDFVVSRAVTQMPKFIPWVQNKIKKEGQNGYPNGIFYLKGGDLKEELKPIKRYKEVIDLSDYFEEEFFDTKKVVYVQVSD